MGRERKEKRGLQASTLFRLLQLAILFHSKKSMVSILLEPLTLAGCAFYTNGTAPYIWQAKNPWDIEIFRDFLLYPYSLSLAFVWIYANPTKKGLTYTYISIK